MATPAGRTRRPNGVTVTKKTSLRLSDEALAVAEATALALGVTRDYFLDELLLHVGRSLPEDGLPTWWTKPIPRAQGVLSLTKSA